MIRLDAILQRRLLLERQIRDCRTPGTTFYKRVEATMRRWEREGH